MKILVLSDVHGNVKLLEKILDKEKDADIKIYLGDFQVSKGDQKKYSKLFDYVVTGNCDYPNVSPITEIIELKGKRFFITHGHMYGSWTTKIDFSLLKLKAIEARCNFILHGHDHIAVVKKEDEIIRFNPGSTTFPRNSKVGTYGIINEKNDEWFFEHINC